MLITVYNPLGNPIALFDIVTQTWKTLTGETIENVEEVLRQVTEYVPSIPNVPQISRPFAHVTSPISQIIESIHMFAVVIFVAFIILISTKLIPKLGGVM